LQGSWILEDRPRGGILRCSLKADGIFSSVRGRRRCRLCSCLPCSEHLSPPNVSLFASRGCYHA
jgi:hypothetical protein